MSFSIITYSINIGKCHCQTLGVVFWTTHFQLYIYTRNLLDRDNHGPIKTKIKRCPVRGKTEKYNVKRGDISVDFMYAKSCVILPLHLFDVQLICFSS